MLARPMKFMAFFISVFMLSFAVCQAEIYELDVTISKTVYSGSNFLNDYIQRKTVLKNQANNEERFEKINNEIINASIASSQNHEMQYNKIFTIEIIDRKINRYGVKGIQPTVDLLKKPNGLINVEYDYYEQSITDKKTSYKKRTKFSTNETAEYRQKYEGFHQTNTSGCFYVHAHELLEQKFDIAKNLSALKSNPKVYAIRTDESNLYGEFLSVSADQKSIKNYVKDKDGTVIDLIEYYYDEKSELPFATKLISTSKTQSTVYTVNSIKIGDERDLYIPQNIPIEQ